MVRRRLAFALAVWLGLAATPSFAAPAASGDLAVVGARIYTAPDAAAIEDGVVLIHDGRIVAVGPGSRVHARKGLRVIDAHGATVTAGLWNSHVHLMTDDLLHAADSPKAQLERGLDAMLTRWGFTTVFDVASNLDNTEAMRRRVNADEVRGPRILTVGDPFYPEGGTPIYVRALLTSRGFPNEEVATPEEAAARAARQLERGADGVKIFSGAIVGGAQGVLPMRLDIARAVVAEAHRRGKPAFAHPSNFAGLDVAIESGVDVLAHPAFDMGPWSAEMVARIRAHHMALTPTLTLLEVEAKKFGQSPDDLAHATANAVQQVKAYADAGGQILFGTDVGYTDAFDTTEEYRLLSRALGWRAILASLTTAPAERFGESAHRGRLAPGMHADLVVLDGDPAVDVTAFARVRDTIRAGRVIWARRP